MGRVKREWIDPVQIFIDRQLATPWREHQLYKDVINLKGRSWAWCPKGLPPLYLSETFSIINTIENELIHAIDKKYHGVKHRVEEEIELILQGYQVQEIADILGIHRWTVWSDLKNWSENHGEEDEERLRAIAAYLND